MSPRSAAVLAAIGALLGSQAPAHASSCKGALETAAEIVSDVASAASDTDTTNAGASAPACEEVSDVHGHRRCSAFGRWGRPPEAAPWFFAVGTSLRRFASPLGEETGSLSHDGEAFSYRVVGPAGRQTGSARRADAAFAGVLSAQVGVRAAHGLFIAGEGELGRLGGDSLVPEMIAGRAGPMPDIRSSGVTVAGALAVAGWRAQLDNVALGVEAAGGFRVLTYHFDSSYRACETSTSISTEMSVLELRARAELRVAPDVAVGASAGRSVIDDGWVAGLHVSLRAFE